MILFNKINTNGVNKIQNCSSGCYLVHGLDQSVDVLFTVTQSTVLDKVLEFSWDTPATVRVGQLEWPQEVASLLEVRTDGVKFVDQVIDGQDTVSAQMFFDDVVVRQSDSLLVDLTVTSLVDQLSNSGVGWVTVSNVRLNQLQKFGGSLGYLDENTVVDLVQSHQLQNLSLLWSHVVDTLDSDNENQFWLAFDVKGTVGLGFTLSIDNSSFRGLVFLLVLSVSLQDNLSLFLVSLI